MPVPSMTREQLGDFSLLPSLPLPPDLLELFPGAPALEHSFPLSMVSLPQSESSWQLPTARLSFLSATESAQGQTARKAEGYWSHRQARHFSTNVHHSKNQFLSLCVCYACSNMCVHVYVSVCVCESQRHRLVSPSIVPHFAFLSQTLTSLEARHEARWLLELTSQPPLETVSAPFHNVSVSGLFPLGTKDSNPGLHACVSTELFFQPLHCYSKVQAPSI